MNTLNVEKSQPVKLGALEFELTLIVSLCRKWGITRLEIFGSAIRQDFDSSSDVDLLLTFEPGIVHGMFALGEMESDFEAAFGRKVDLVEKRLLKWVIRDRVLQEARLVFEA